MKIKIEIEINFAVVTVLLHILSTYFL